MLNETETSELASPPSADEETSKWPLRTPATPVEPKMIPPEPFVSETLPTEPPSKVTATLVAAIRITLWPPIVTCSSWNVPDSGYEWPRTRIVSGFDAGSVSVTRKYGPPWTLSVSVPPPASVNVWLTAAADVLNATETSAAKLTPFWSVADGELEILDLDEAGDALVRDVEEPVRV